MTIERDFKIGCDPEFAFVTQRGNNIREAEEIITDNSQGEVGLDGCGRIPEIRPDPSTHPSEVVKNIRIALVNMATEQDSSLRVNWRAGTCVGEEPIGGHIHFGTKEVGFKNREFPTTLIDSYVAQPILMLESRDESRRRRMDSDYGQLGDLRTDHEHGVEYRTLGSWLTSPWIALGVLSLAKVVAWEGLVKGASADISLRITNSVYREYNEGVVRPRCPKIYSKIQEMTLYKLPEYKAPIDFIFNLIMGGRKWFPKCGMMSAWGITSKSNIIPKLTFQPVSITHIMEILG